MSGRAAGTLAKTVGGGCALRCLRLGLAAALLSAGMGLAAQAGEYRAPRTPWNTPDLNGPWSNSSLTQLERDDDLKGLVVPEAEARAYEAKHLGKPPNIPHDEVGGAASEYWELNVGLARIRGQARTSWITSPADGKLPLTAAAKAFMKTRREMRRTTADDPEGRQLSERCIEPSAAGPPLTNGGYNDNFQFVQTPDALAIWVEWDHDVRIIRLDKDARRLSEPVRRWFGDSIGHWEGDTLVVETTNFLPQQVDAPMPKPSDDMRVVERFTRTAPKEIFYEFSVTAPAVYSQTWRGEMVLHPASGRLFEYACHEGNYALPAILAAARAGHPPGEAPAK